MIALFKFIHIAALLPWCAALVALPLLLARHDAHASASRYARLRRASHFTYVWAMTPLAVLTVTAGTVLIFLRGVFEPWLFAKLAVVGVLVLLHAWLGHVIVQTGERGGDYPAPHAGLLVALGLAAMTATLVLVLAKPVLPADVLPTWLQAPQARQLPWLDEVPN